MKIGHVRYINILTWLRGFQVKPLYLVLFSLYLSLFWELRDKGNLKNLQFLPESLGAMLEYWYIERGLLLTFWWVTYTYALMKTSLHKSVFTAVSRKFVSSTNGEKLTRRCRKLLWVTVVFTVAWVNPGGRKQHKHLFVFSRSLLLNLLEPQCNQAKPNSYYLWCQSALSRTLLHFRGTTFVETAVYSRLRPPHVIRERDHLSSVTQVSQIIKSFQVKSLYLEPLVSECIETRKRLTVWQNVEKLVIQPWFLKEGSAIYRGV